VPKQSSRLSAGRLRELARAGAETMLKQLQAEIIAIERTFPELSLPRKRHAVGRALKTARNRGRQMSEAARKEISKRMKRYWAERRKAKAKVK
jgi:Holliday junction resolvasome RuvABC endonuclease subunit